MKEFLVGCLVTVPVLTLLIGGCYLYDMHEELFKKIMVGVLIASMGSLGLIIIGYLTWNIGNLILYGAPK